MKFKVNDRVKVITGICIGCCGVIARLNKPLEAYYVILDGNGATTAFFEGEVTLDEEGIS